jgi:hypothetical protein
MELIAAAGAFAASLVPDAQQAHLNVPDLAHSMLSPKPCIACKYMRLP